ncbi:MAG: hypothetical protein K0V04_19630 [Deltaproteobacteria bacterium]|nr:hypothetical protein [Deltaproteobacteria bacterium]
MVFGALLLLLLILAGIPLARDHARASGTHGSSRSELLAGLLFFPELLLLLVSRLLTSGRRRPPPATPRRGGLGGLPAPLVELLTRGREVEAAVADLESVRSDHQQTRQTSSPLPGRSWLTNDRFVVATRRNYEDALVHVTRTLLQWCTAADSLDESSRALLSTLASRPDVAAILEAHPWLPREVYEAGSVRFRDDLERCEAKLGRLAVELRMCDDAVLLDRASAYR